MHYNVGDKVKLKKKYDDNERDIHLSKGTSGEIKSLDDFLNLYKVSFENCTTLVFITEDYLEAKTETTL